MRAGTAACYLCKNESVDERFARLQISLQTTKWDIPMLIIYAFGAEIIAAAHNLTLPVLSKVLKLLFESIKIYLKSNINSILDKVSSS